MQGRLNYTRVQQAYLEADWNPLAKELKLFLRNPGAKADRSDSIWALKYLGAIRTSRVDSRLQGEEDFRRLLVLDPSFEASNLGDLFVSEDVLSAFRRIKTESRFSQGASLPQAAAPAPSPAAPDRQKPGNKAGLWAAAGAGAVAIAAGAGYYLWTRDRSREVVIQIPFPSAETGP